MDASTAEGHLHDAIEALSAACNYDDTHDRAFAILQDLEELASDVGDAANNAERPELGTNWLTATDPEVRHALRRAKKAQRAARARRSAGLRGQA